MKKPKNFLDKLKKYPVDIWFFFLFLFTFSLTNRKVLFYYPLKGTFNEYAGLYIYISDIFLVFSIFFWIVFELYNNYIVSSRKKLWITYLQHKLSTMSTVLFSRPILYIPLFLCLWSFLSILWSENKPVATFRSIKLLEFYFLYLFIIFRLVPILFHVEQYGNQKESSLGLTNVPHLSRGMFHVEHSIQGGTFSMGRNIFFLVISLSAIIQFILALIQAIRQKSVGLFWLKESVISPDMPGIAKTVLNGEKYIRSYGLFPHPNILGGFLLFSIILTLLFIKLFNDRFINCSTWNNSTAIRQYQTLGIRILPIIIYFALTIQLLGLILTLSKSAILGLVTALLYIYISRPSVGKTSKATEIALFGSNEIKMDYNCSTWNNYKIIILSCLIVFVSLFLIFKQNTNKLIFQSLNERLLYINVSPAYVALQHISDGRETIKEITSLLFGIGQGQFVWEMQHYSHNILESWQFQPVHNVFLLIWSELGVVGLVLFLIFLFRLFHSEKNVPRGTFYGSDVEQSMTNIRQKTKGSREGNREDRAENKSILCNTFEVLSMDIALCYFKGILLGFIFIMLFDHYFWDIQQGSLILWTIMGFIAGLQLQKK